VVPEVALRRGRRWTRARRNRALKLAFTLGLAAVYFLPIYWMFKSSFQVERDIRVTELNLGIGSPTLANYANALSNERFTTGFYNSSVLALSTMVVALITATLAAYSLARLPNPVTRVLGRFFLMAYISPGVMVIIPLFILLTNLGLQNTYQGLIITYSSFAVPFGTWLLIGYFRSLPQELEDAALIDGCSRLGALVRIVFPVSLPGILTVVIFTFSLVVNEFVYAITFISSSTNRTVAVGVPTDLIRGDLFNWPGIMAAILIPSIPLALVYNAFLNRFIAGFTGGAFR